METLITIGVVIYIILSIRKALSFGKDGGKKPAKGSWQDKLQEMARQIKEDLEKAQREAEGLPPAPPPLPPGNIPEDPEWEDLEEDADILVMEEQVNEEAQDLELAVVPESTADENEMPEPVLGKKPEHAWDKAPVKKRFGANLDRKNLKQALIWSEILAKPLSLRE